MIPYLRCDACGRATITKDGVVGPREVCWDAEREKNLCFWCYQGVEKESIELLPMGREVGDVA